MPKNINMRGLKDFVSSQLPSGSPLREASFVQETSFESKNRATVNIESLKLFVSQNFPRDHPLRKLLAAERSTMSVPDYLAKLESWLCLLREIK